MVQQYARMMQSDFAEKLRRADEGLFMPEMPDDLLAYLGNIVPLNLTETEMRAARNLVRSIIRRNGAEYVWDNRVGIRYELSYMHETFGLDWANNLGE